jgi:hypothetical protein
MGSVWKTNRANSKSYQKLSKQAYDEDKTRIYLHITKEKNLHKISLAQKYCVYIYEGLIVVDHIE